MAAVEKPRYYCQVLSRRSFLVHFDGGKKKEGKKEKKTKAQTLTLETLISFLGCFHEGRISRSRLRKVEAWLN